MIPDRKIKKETIDKIIERHQTNNTYYGARYATYGIDEKYVAFVETKNKEYLFMSKGPNEYELLKIYEMKK